MTLRIYQKHSLRVASVDSETYVARLQEWHARVELAKTASNEKESERSMIALVNESVMREWAVARLHFYVPTRAHKEKMSVREQGVFEPIFDAYLSRDPEILVLLEEHQLSYELLLIACMKYYIDDKLMRIFDMWWANKLAEVADPSSYYNYHLSHMSVIRSTSYASVMALIHARLTPPCLLTVFYEFMMRLKREESEVATAFIARVRRQYVIAHGIYGGLISGVESLFLNEQVEHSIVWPQLSVREKRLLEKEWLKTAFKDRNYRLMPIELAREIFQSQTHEFLLSLCRDAPKKSFEERMKARSSDGTPPDRRAA